MRLVTFEKEPGRYELGAVVGDLVFDISECSDLPDEIAAQRKEGKVRAACRMTRLLAMGPERLKDLEERVGDFSTRVGGAKPPFALPLDGVRLAAPVPWPNKLLLLAGNYSEHIKEFNLRESVEKEQSTPRVFMKPPTTTLIPTGDPIVIPRNAQKIDYELELAVVMGGTARFVSPEEAEGLIAGYTILNDVSERSLRIDSNRTPREGDKWFDWLNGKWFDTFAPMGPCLVTPGELGEMASLRMELRVNGETRQKATAGQMIFSPDELISWTSRLMTLEPGDIISTGTPSGVGAATGKFLQPGDVVEAEIEGIGVLKNPVSAGIGK